MLKFQLEAKEKIPQNRLLKMSLIDILDDRRHFAVFVGGQMFFEDMYFPIIEFTKYALVWTKNKNKDFLYNTIDDYQNPLFAFRRVKNGWKLQSVWQKFICDETFSDDVVKSFISSLIQQVLIT